MVLLIAAGIAFTACWGFLCVALYFAIEEPLGPPWAAVVTALAAFVTALVLLVLARSAVREHHTVAEPAAPPNPHQTPQILSALAGEEIGRFLQERPKSAAGVALLAGLAIGLSPELRNMVGSLFDPPKK